METRMDVFQAIADPTRKAIIGTIAKEPINVNAIAKLFDVGRQAVSLYLKILAECGLLTMAGKGIQRDREISLIAISIIMITRYCQIITV